ncbi:hypothetical protein IC582_029766 [Cucumis melo]|uniref:Serine/threonine-protein kinase fray2 n=2 Tax=Cucumis melo TaxID=3656 RepID=A0A1S3AV81_CUCME|nr:uncharacterized protein LOC103483188 [Cucumis melo]TYJ99129.1 serine/threonine-protein kinase fray2 [Cucumis melo var. makuwa]
MEESKAAAYYDELTRKGEGAARFKRGLGFAASDSNSDVVSASKGSALPSSSSFLSSFVKASSPSKPSEFEKQAQLEAIQNKLKKKKPSSPDRQERRPRDLERDRRKSSPRRRSLSKERERHSHSRRRSSSRDREKHSRRRSRSRDRYGDKYRDRDRERSRRRRSRSRSDPDRDRRRRRSRSLSAERKRSDDDGSNGGGKQKDRKVERQKTEGVDYSRLIEGYDMMSPAERVKAKMKLQLAETARMDDTKGTGPGWERFEFDKDAPLDDEEIEAAEDDATLVKHIGQSFRFSAIEARKEEQIKAAHDEAMFGAPVGQLLSTTDDEVKVEAENERVKESCDSGMAANLLSEKIIAKQQGSWRDRARKA